MKINPTDTTGDSPQMQHFSDLRWCESPHHATSPVVKQLIHLMERTLIIIIMHLYHQLLIATAPNKCRE